VWSAAAAKDPLAAEDVVSEAEKRRAVRVAATCHGRNLIFLFQIRHQFVGQVSIAESISSSFHCFQNEIFWPITSWTLSAGFSLSLTSSFCHKKLFSYQKKLIVEKFFFFLSFTFSLLCVSPKKKTFFGKKKYFWILSRKWKSVTVCDALSHSRLAQTAQLH